MKKYVDTSRLIVREINKNLAKKMIVEYHYSHKWSSCRYALGLFYEMDNEHAFFDEKEEKLIGVAIYGYPVGRLAAGSISSYLKPDEVLELTRLFIFDDYGSNIESYFLSQTFKWLKKNDKTIKGLVSYSDPEQNHQGTIYQATNWIYQGNNIRLMKNYGIKLTDGGTWMHSRTVSATFGSHNVEHLKKKIGHTFWRKEEPEKHRYVYLLCNKKDKKKIMDTIKHQPLPYPKFTEYEEVIEEIQVDDRI